MYDIELRNINLTRNNRCILNDVTVNFPKGRTSVVLGGSGSGKSTLLKVAGGLTIPDSGDVLINGQDLFSLGEEEMQSFRRHSGFVFQDAALWANKNVYQNVSLPLKVHCHDMSNEVVKKRVEDMLRLVGYEDELDIRPDLLSLGKRNMVGFARALIASPRFICMDAPMSFVDISISRNMEHLIRELHDVGATMLATFLREDMIEKVADNVVIIHKGRVIEFGALEAVKKSIQPETMRIVSDIFDNV